MEVKEDLSATGLVAVLEGREKTAIPYEAPGKNGFIDRHWAKSRRPLVELSIPLNTSQVIKDGKVKPGKYELPFEIELPDSLPSTIVEANSPGTEFCSIEYGIEAELQGCENPADYICRYRVVVLGKPLPKDPVPYMNTLSSDVANTSLRRLYLAKEFGKVGQLIVGVLMPDTLLDRGEDCMIALSCRNRTDFDITHIRAEIRETFRWSAQDLVEQRTIVISSFELGLFADVNKSKYKATVEHDLDEIQTELREAKHSFTVKIPKNAHDTFSGTLIKVSHEIIVDFETSHDQSNPRLAIPIQVGPPSLAQGSERHLQTNVSIKPNHWESTSQSDRITVSRGSAILGGTVVHDHGKTRILRRGSNVPSFENLLGEMKEHISDYDLIDSHLQDPEWLPIFEELTPQKFSTVIKTVNLEFDQCKVAALIAPVIYNFTVEYLVAAMRGASDWNRLGMVDRLIFYCTDLDTHAQVLECELTRFEQAHCAKYFRM